MNGGFGHLLDTSLVEISPREAGDDRPRDDEPKG